MKGDIFMENINFEDTVKSVDRTVLGVCAGFAVGFILGASLVAIVDYYDNKKTQLKRIQRDSDENYIYSE